VSVSAKPPRLFQSGMTGRIYISTSYTIKANGLVVSNTKYDVTEDFEAIEASREQEREARNNADDE
jgi:hypothetical protein